ncbi:MAG TPA: replication factor C small subunit, partial [Candidatus Bathyarchaeota archaeon]|nr:replication factor C small subunit [Candidatus Bathyarchaeota archaeon]HEX69475.1 replication factor C small subunit [Candidatus Bathyarchaeota archaeon]
MAVMMWTEKYRPRTLDEIVDQEEIVSRLKGFVKARNVPHCLFAGPPGTGKTTAALCMAHDLYGENFANYIMELNASDERGINVIRETVKTFARTIAIGEVPFKIFILDEADNMTADAQQALRRTMERYTETCRFILIANYSGRIIEPIQSRCAPFRFTYLPPEKIAERLRFIAEKENVELQDTGLKAILDISGGDMRKAI